MKYFLQLPKILKKKSVHDKTLTRPDLSVFLHMYCFLCIVYRVHNSTQREMSGRC